MPSENTTLGQRMEGFAFTSILAAVTKSDSRQLFWHPSEAQTPASENPLGKGPCPLPLLGQVLRNNLRVVLRFYLRKGKNTWFCQVHKSPATRADE